MNKEFLENYCKQQIGKEVEFGSFSYELQKIGFEDIEDNEYNMKELLESGVCYYSFVDKIGIGEKNEDLDGCKIKLEFDVLIWNGNDESESASEIKVTNCILEKF